MENTADHSTNPIFQDSVVMLIVIGLIGAGLLFLLVKSMFKSSISGTSQDVTRSISEDLLTASEISARLHG